MGTGRPMKSLNIYKGLGQAIYMCNGLCLRLYKGKRIAPGISMYLGNKRCTHCDRFVSLAGIRLGKSNWRCRCCGYPVRHTPFSGRKSLQKDINKVSALPNLCSVSNEQLTLIKKMI